MQCISITEQNRKLLQELEKHYLRDLYQKFVKWGITQDNVWNLTSYNLDQMELSLQQKQRYFDAKEAETGTDTYRSLRFFFKYAIFKNYIA